MKKGIYKGFRYVSHIFGPNYKEPELQIGFPTDVKHVAHIGWEGPSAAAPTWMNEFRSAPLTGFGPELAKAAEDDYLQTPPHISQDHPNNDGDGDGDGVGSPAHAKPSRRHASCGSVPLDSSAGSFSPILPRLPRRKKSTEAASAMGSSPEGGQQQARRVKNKKKKDKDGDEQRDLPNIPKQIRRKKKSKGGSVDGSTPALTDVVAAEMSELDISSSPAPPKAMVDDAES